MAVLLGYSLKVSLQGGGVKGGRSGREEDAVGVACLALRVQRDVFSLAVAARYSRPSASSNLPRRAGSQQACQRWGRTLHRGAVKCCLRLGGEVCRAHTPQGNA